MLNVKLYPTSETKARSKLKTNKHGGFYENKNFLDFCMSSKYFIGIHHISHILIAKYDKWREHNRFGYANRIKHCFSVISYTR